MMKRVLYFSIARSTLQARGWSLLQYGGTKFSEAGFFESWCRVCWSFGHGNLKKETFGDPSKEKDLEEIEQGRPRKHQTGKVQEEGGSFTSMILCSKLCYPKGFPAIEKSRVSPFTCRFQTLKLASRLGARQPIWNCTLWWAMCPF